MRNQKIGEIHDDQEFCILVEGAGWGDAEFYGRRLLKAAEANRLLQEAKRAVSFRADISTLEFLHFLDFGIMAMVFVSRFCDKNFHTFTIDPASSEDLNDFALMVEMGFFELTGDRYQTVIPETLDRERVMQAHLRLAATEDERWIHPEKLVVKMPRSLAHRYQSLLSSIEQDQRLADRRALLFAD